MLRNIQKTTCPFRLSFLFLLGFSLLVICCEKPEDRLGPPPTPTFTLDYQYDWQLCQLRGYYLTIVNTTPDTTGVTFTTNAPGTNSTWQPYYVEYNPLQDTTVITVTITATRNNTSTSSSQTIALVKPRPPFGFDITKGVIHSLPLVQPNGNPWPGSLASVGVLTAYHSSYFFDANALPTTQGFFRTNNNVPCGPSVDPEPAALHKIRVWAYTTPSFDIDSFTFIPNDYRIPATDSGHVVLQNANTHIELDLKFYD